MLAATAKLSELEKLPKIPYYASHKIDGIRCLMIKGTAYSRSLKPIRNQNVQTLASSMWKDGIDLLDGELTAGLGNKVSFQDTTSNIMSFDGSNDFIYNVFDAFSETVPLNTQNRTSLYQDSVKVLGNSQVISVEQTVVQTLEEIRDALERSLDLGYEGLMLKSIYGGYKHGRSTLREGLLLKLKPFVDSEATIIGFEPWYENTSESFTDELGHSKKSKCKDFLLERPWLGSLLCKTVDGVEFNLGSGFSQVERLDIWSRRMGLLGKQVRFKYLDYGIKEKPRSPVFLALLEVLE